MEGGREGGLDASMYLASGLWICLPTYSCTHVQLPMYGYMHDLCVQDWALLQLRYELFLLQDSFKKAS